MSSKNSQIPAGPRSVSPPKKRFHGKGEATGAGGSEGGEGGEDEDKEDIGERGEASRDKFSGANFNRNFEMAIIQAKFFRLKI
jgi:hypothetical protein